MSHNKHITVVAHIIWLALLSLSIFYIATSLHVVSDITQFMPNDKSANDDNKVQLLLDELQKGNTARLLILRMKGLEDKKLANLSRQLKSKLDKNKSFTNIHNGQQAINTQQFISGKYRKLYEYRYLLAPNSTLSKDELTESFNQRLSELRSGLNLFKNTLSSDPQNHFIKYLWKLTERGGTTTHHGVWFDKNKSSTLLLVELNLDDFNLDKQEMALKDIYQTINKLSNNKNLQVDLTGTPVMAVKTRAAIQSTSKTLSTIALILMAILFWWSYRSMRLFFIATIPLASAVIAALTMTNIIFQQVHGIIIAFGITLLGVCLDYPVHLFSHRNKKQTAQQTLRSIWPTLRLGVISTSLAYLAMLGSGFAGLSQLSIFAISGLIASLLVTRWIVPFWLQMIPIDSNLRHQYLSYLIQLKFTLNKKYFFGLSIIIFCLLSIASNYDSIWSHNISDLSPIPNAAKKLDRELRQSVGAPDVNHVFILSDKNSELLLQRTERIKYELESLQLNSLASNIFSITDFVPSQKTQIKNQQQLPQSDSLKLNVEQAVSDFPFKKKFFDPFLRDIEQSKTLIPLSVDNILATPLGKNLQQDLFFKNDQWHSIIRLAGVKNEQALFTWLESKPNIQPYYLNLRQATSDLMTDYQVTALFRLLLGAIIITLILFFVRPVKRVGFIILPVILAVLLSLSIQIMLGTPITLFHILALLLIIGIGLDYSLFFDRTWTSSEDYHHRLHGIFVSAASTLITFGILGFSDIPVLSALGQTVTFGVLGCFALTLVFNINNYEKTENT